MLLDSAKSKDAMVLACGVGVCVRGGTPCNTGVSILRDNSRACTENPPVQGRHALRRSAICYQGRVIPSDNMHCLCCHRCIVDALVSGIAAVYH